MPELSWADIWVIAAAGTYVLGYLIINQVVLRLLVLLGTVFYIVYYAVVSVDPLWTAIWTSVALLLANLIGLGLLLWSRSVRAIPREYADLYSGNPIFAKLPPGHFHAIMSIGKRYVVEEDTVITREGARNEHFYFIVSGSTTADKLGHRFDMPSGTFHGEVAFLLDHPSAATTTVLAGSEVIQWSVAKVRRRAAIKPSFAIALEAAFSVDLALKVARAISPHAHISPLDPAVAGRVS